MLSETPYAALIAGMIITGLYLSNYFYDKGCEQYVSRKAGHGVAGMGILLCALIFSSAWWPIILASSFTLLLGVARIIKPEAFRGVGGIARQHAFAEVYLPAAGTLSLVVGWAWLGDRWLAVVPVLFVAWGDMVTGLVRSRFYGREVKGAIGSLAMIVVCLLVAYFYKPYWIGVIGASVATMAEKYTPLSRGLWDDNWTIVISSLLVMGVLSTCG